MELSKDQKIKMLQLVRSHYEYKLKNGEMAKIPNDVIYKDTAGIFVTLHKHGELRGCIGYIIGFKPLSESLFEIAESAAFKDPRFESLNADELDQIEIEISLLSPPDTVHHWQQIIPGKHGVVLKSGNHSATFLPQVAVEQGWNLDEMLSNLSMKAGLEHDEYKDNKVQFQVYTALVFSESEMKADN